MLQITLSDMFSRPGERLLDYKRLSVKYLTQATLPVRRQIMKEIEASEPRLS